jgi:L-fuconolactonase
LLDAPTAERLLDRWSDGPIVGVRHLAHRDPDRDLLARPEVDDALALLAERGLTFDVCAETEHLLAIVPSIAERHPALRLIVDHLAKPPIRQRGWEPWASLIRAAADAPNVTVKLSGLNTAAGPGDGADDFAPYVDHALGCFGPTRMMYGGDWPFALLAADSYGEIWRGLRPCLDGLTAAERREVLSETARRVYRLPRASVG